MTAQDLIVALRAAFEEELKAKTGWGRVEVAAALERAFVKALAENLQLKGDGS